MKASCMQTREEKINFNIAAMILKNVLQKFGDDWVNMVRGWR